MTPTQSQISPSILVYEDYPTRLRVEGSGFGVWGLGLNPDPSDQVEGLSSTVQGAVEAPHLIQHLFNTFNGSRFRVQGAGFRVQGSGFRVQGSGFRVWGIGFRSKPQPSTRVGSVAGAPVPRVHERPFQGHPNPILGAVTLFLSFFGDNCPCLPKNPPKRSQKCL